ncbi:MAG: NAD(P)-dependent oxidoreductase, partial [Acidimicrobiaceae bacterium]|nr:NAD(P)-dependent oxidoreductase [Acidimicrobiaceae bacterium]
FDPVAGAAERASATPAASIREVASRGECILLSLPDTKTVEEVVAGDRGLVEAGHPGQVVVDLSTVAPAASRALHEQLATVGVDHLDVGISGGAAAAEDGSLTLMVGGPAAVLERVRPVLATFSARVFAMGHTGAGHATKLLNNFLNAVSLAATAEVMVAGKKAGLDLRTLLDVINASSGANWATQKRFPRIVEGDYLEGGLTSSLMTKDVVLYVDYLHEIGVASLNASGPLASFGVAANLGYGNQISNRVVDAIGDLSGGVRLHEER